MCRNTRLVDVCFVRLRLRDDAPTFHALPRRVPKGKLIIYLHFLRLKIYAHLKVKCLVIDSDGECVYVLIVNAYYSAF